MGKTACLISVVLVVVTVAPACGSDSESRGEQVDTPVEADPTCNGIPNPVSIEAVERVLREGGFSMERVEGSASCDPGTDPDEDLIIELSNRGGGSYEEAEEGEGIVTCSITRGPIYPGKLGKNLDEPAYSPVFVGRKAVWWFKNIECYIYAGDAHPDEQVAKLDEAMERLAGLPT